jgi:hypothetical protein
MATSPAGLLDPLKPKPLLDPAAPPPLAPEYEPLPAPDNLLATAVGPSTAPLPPIDPATYEDDDVVKQMNAITSQDSDYMKLARTSGLQTANKRGLLNSSIAAGASQAEALKAAAPLAGQNAQQMAARNLTRVQGYFDQKKQEAQFGHEVGMQGRDIENKLKMQGIDIDANEATQLREFETRLKMQGIDIGAESERLGRQLAANRELADLNIAAESERLGRQLTAQEEGQIRDIASREGLAKMEAEMRESQFTRGLASEEARANLDVATRTKLAELDRLSSDQKAALAGILEIDKIYASTVSDLNANKDMPAPARDAAIQSALALRNSQINLPAAILGINLTWPTSAGGAAAGAAPGAFTPPPAATAAPGSYWSGPPPDQILAMFGDGKPGGMEMLRSYNSWAAANGVPPLTQPGEGESGSGYFDTIGKYSGIGIASGLLG